MTSGAFPIYFLGVPHKTRVMRAPLTLAIAAALLLAMSCDGATGPRRHGQPNLVFRANAATIHDTLYSFCGIEGALPVPQLSLPPWSGQASVTLYRWVATTHGVIASRQIAVTVSFSVTEDSNALVLTLGSPVDTTLTGSVLHAGLDPTNGTWTCPATFPCRDDSMLQSRGYDPEPPPTGNWSLRWMNPL
jgi:hypothetical protein